MTHPNMVQFISGNGSVAAGEPKIIHSCADGASSSMQELDKPVSKSDSETPVNELSTAAVEKEAEATTAENDAIVLTRAT